MKQRPFPKSRRRDRRRGFVLPMTLLVIALTAIVLVGVARQSLQVATEATQAHRDLQRKWGTISCQRALLEQANAWLSVPTEELRHVIGDAGHRRLVFPLGALDFDVLLADESAKINLNAMIRNLPPPTVARMVTELAQSAKPLRVSLRPHSFASAAIVGEEKKRELARLDSWGQVFPMQQFADPADAPRQIAAATVDVTCWGNGKLNVLRASETALEILCHQFANSSVAQRLISLRNRAELNSDDELLAALELDPRETARLGTHLTVQSSAYSMWLNVTSLSNQSSRASGPFQGGWYEYHVVAEKEQASSGRTDGGENESEEGRSAGRPPELPKPRARPIPQARFAW